MESTIAIRFASLAIALSITGCATPTGPSASAKLQATRGNATTGEVRFTQSGDKVLVTGEISGLKPNAEHGFHVHEKGDCSSGDGLSTGGHFNPGGKAHGSHGAGEHHSGDLPSLKANISGIAKFSFESNTISVGGGSKGVSEFLCVRRDCLPTVSGKRNLS